MAYYKKALGVIITALAIMLSSAMAHAEDMVVYFHPDAQGSAVAAYSESGDVCWHQDYTPYGEKIDPLDNFPLAGCGLLGEERGFTGHTQDLSGLVYMQQRYYDPTLMRFLSIDPMGVNPGDERTFNRYSYAANNPYKYVDPDGEAFFLPALIPAAKFLAGFAVKETASAVASGLARSHGGVLGTVAAELFDYTSASKVTKKTLRKFSKVRPGQTGSYGDLKSRKRRFGETEALDMDHQPSFAAQVAAKERALGRTLTKAERSAVKANSPAVASPRQIHQKTSPTYGGRNTADRISADSADLGAAAKRDRAIFNEAMRNR